MSSPPISIWRPRRLPYLRRLGEDLDQVVDRDRLGAVVDPLRGDHDRQALGQVEERAERLAAGADHGRSAEVRDGDAGRGQVLGRRVAALEVLGTPVGEAAQVDDLLDAGVGRRGGEVLGALDVALGEVALPPAPHRVHEVVGRLDPLKRLGQRLAAKHVPGHDLAPGRGQVLGLTGLARHRARRLALLGQAQAEPAPDVAGRAGDQRVASAWPSRPTLARAPGRPSRTDRP